MRRAVVDLATILVLGTFVGTVASAFILQWLEANEWSPILTLTSVVVLMLIMATVCVRAIERAADRTWRKREQAEVSES